MGTRALVEPSSLQRALNPGALCHGLVARNAAAPSVHGAGEKFSRATCRRGELVVGGNDIRWPRWCVRKQTPCPAVSERHWGLEETPPKTLSHADQQCQFSRFNEMSTEHDGHQPPWHSVFDDIVVNSSLPTLSAVRRDSRSVVPRTNVQKSPA